MEEGEEISSNKQYIIRQFTIRLIIILMLFCVYQHWNVHTIYFLSPSLSTSISLSLFVYTIFFLVFVTALNVMFIDFCSCASSLVLAGLNGAKKKENKEWKTIFIKKNFFFGEKRMYNISIQPANQPASSDEESKNRWRRIMENVHKKKKENIIIFFLKHINTDWGIDDGKNGIYSCIKVRSLLKMYVIH